MYMVKFRNSVITMIIIRIKKDNTVLLHYISLATRLGRINFFKKLWTFLELSLQYKTILSICSLILGIPM